MIFEGSSGVAATAVGPGIWPDRVCQCLAYSTPWVPGRGVEGLTAVIVLALGETWNYYTCSTAETWGCNCAGCSCSLDIYEYIRHMFIGN